VSSQTTTESFKFFKLLLLYYILFRVSLKIRLLRDYLVHKATHMIKTKKIALFALDKYGVIDYEILKNLLYTTKAGRVPKFL